MVKLVCHDYGFSCNFKAEGKEALDVIEKFDKHCSEKHRIHYGKEALMQFIFRKKR